MCRRRGSGRRLKSQGGSALNELTIQDVFKILRKWIALILIVPIVVTIGSAYYAYNYMVDTYSTSSAIYALRTYEAATGMTTYDISTTTNFTNDYIQMFSYTDILGQAGDALGIPTLSRQVNVSVTNQANTRILILTANGRDPEMCMLAANKCAELFVSFIKGFTEYMNAYVLKEAPLPMGPSGPNRIRITAMSGLIALVACVALAFAVELLNTRVSSESQIEEGMRLPLLSRVTDYRKDIERYLGKEGAGENILYQFVPSSVQESIRTLASNLQFVSMDKPLRSISVTSATPDEGKSSIAVMLAAAMAEMGKLVLLVDMDMRNSSIGKFMKQRNRYDLLDYLTNRARLDEVMAPTGLRRMYFIDNKHKMASFARMINSESFDRFLKEAYDSFDLVIFDTPPLGMFIDAALLTSKLDAAMIVLAQNRVDIRLAREIADQLSKSGANVLGVVLNFIKKARGRRYYYYYRYSRYGGYGKYGSYAEAFDKRKRKKPVEEPEPQ